MASSYPPPLIPIHGSDSVYYSEENNSTANKLNKQTELKFDEFFNSENHKCFKITNASSNGEYNHQQQSSYHYESTFHTRSHNLTTQSLIEINKLKPRLSTRPNSQQSFSPGSDIPADLLFHQDSLKDDPSSHQEIVSDIDCYWYKQNLENLNTIECLRKEIMELRTKLTTAESHRGNISGDGKCENKNAFKCRTCRKEYKTERGLEAHRNSRHGPNRIDCQFGNFRAPHPWPPKDVFGNPTSSYNKGAKHHGSDRSLLSSRDSCVPW